MVFEWIVVFERIVLRRADQHSARAQPPVWPQRRGDAFAGDTLYDRIGHLAQAAQRLASGNPRLAVVVRVQDRSSDRRYDSHFARRTIVAGKRHISKIAPSPVIGRRVSTREPDGRAPADRCRGVVCAHLSVAGDGSRPCQWAQRGSRVATHEAPAAAGRLETPTICHPGDCLHIMLTHRQLPVQPAAVGRGGRRRDVSHHSRAPGPGPGSREASARADHKLAERDSERDSFGRTDARPAADRGARDGGPRRRRSGPSGRARRHTPFEVAPDPILGQRHHSRGAGRPCCTDLPPVGFRGGSYPKCSTSPIHPNLRCRRLGGAC
jgi:hypothetical protein